jgi:hypothetical protein
MDSEGRRLLQRMQQASEGSSLIKARSTKSCTEDPIQEISSALKLATGVATWRSRPPASWELVHGYHQLDNSWPHCRFYWKQDC